MLRWAWPHSETRQRATFSRAGPCSLVVERSEKFSAAATAQQQSNSQPASLPAQLTAWFSLGIELAGERSAESSQRSQSAGCRHLWPLFSLSFLSLSAHTSEDSSASGESVADHIKRRGYVQAGWLFSRLTGSGGNGNGSQLATERELNGINLFLLPFGSGGRGSQRA